jgi:sugar lactone lactonase YvrE
MFPAPALRRLSVSSALLLGCAGGGEQAPLPAPLRTWSYDSTLVFPRDGSLIRPEDGVALPDGRLLVTDQVSGLRMVAPDGSSQPFGTMAAAGYAHQPPARSGGANGVTLEPDGTHLLVADVFGAAIYRVEVATGAAVKLYQHRYGINTAIRDSRGNLWFTQSAHNTPEEGEARLWAAVDLPKPEGALYRLELRNDRPAGEAKLMVDSLFFANGVAIDERAGQLYVAETVGGRVWRFRVDLATGALTERTIAVDSTAVDNLEFDDAGRLWMALPLANEVQVLDPATGSRQTVFRSQTPEQQRIVNEFTRRGQAGQSRMELFTPAVWAPLPGPITGMILGRGNAPVYLTGLGNALLKLTR